MFRFKEMVRLLFAILLVPPLCLAQEKYTEEELWKGVPAERLSLEHLQLLVKYEPPYVTGTPGREYLAPHRIGIGLHNHGENLVEEIDIYLIFMHKTAFVHLKMPDGKTLNYKMQRGFRGQKNWAAILPGDETWYSLKPLWAWFPEISESADGLYEVWWEIGANRSDRLVLRKTGENIKPENDSEQAGTGHPLQDVGAADPG